MFIKLKESIQRKCVICKRPAEYLAVSDPGEKIMVLEDGKWRPCIPTSWCKNCASKYFPEELPVNK